VDPATANQLIAAGAGLGGALGGALLGLWGSAIQHKRTIEHERKKGVRARAEQAAERCRSLVAEYAKLVSEGEQKWDGDDPGWLERGNAMIRIREDIRVESLHLPAEVRRRVDFASNVLTEARDLLEDGYFYCGPSSIAEQMKSETSDCLAAFVRDDEDLPGWSEMADHLDRALTEQDAQRRLDYAEDLQRTEDAKRQWLDHHPAAARPSEPDHPTGWFARLRRRLTRGAVRA
jgi:hypothetical protein